MAQPAQKPASTNEDSLTGFLFAMSAYVFWGFLPLYMKMLAHIPPQEVIAHRVLWSLPIAAIVLLVQGRTADIKLALRNPSMLGMAAVSALLVSLNWGVYVWAIGAGHTLDAALGYYINPLFSIFLGAVLLKEHLTKLQKYAVLLAAVAVIVLTIGAGRLPLVALTLTLSWGFYAYFKKQLPIGPNQGFTLEILLLTPFATAYIIYTQATGNSHFFNGNSADTALLFGCGFVTAFPLMLYANGAKLLRLSTIGIMQYVAPTLIFLIAVFAFGEPFGLPRMIAFPMIWAALVLYSIAMFRGRKPKAG